MPQESSIAFKTTSAVLRSVTEPPRPGPSQPIARSEVSIKSAHVIGSPAGLAALRAPRTWKPSGRAGYRAKRRRPALSRRRGIRRGAAPARRGPDGCRKRSHTCGHAGDLVAPRCKPGAVGDVEVVVHVGRGEGIGRARDRGSSASDDQVAVFADGKRGA